MSTTRSPDRVPFAAAVLACTLLLAACLPPAAGRPISQPLAVSAFESVDVRGAATIEVAVGQTHSLVIEGSQEDVESIASRVENGTLVIEDRDGWLWQPRRGSLQLRIATPALKALTVSGAAKVRLHGLSGGDLSLAVQGAGDLNGSGTVSRLDAQLSGAGNMELSGLTATDATVVVNGAGNMDLNVTGSLVATVNGVGNIHYRGNPAQVKTAMNGVGSISPR